MQHARLVSLDDKRSALTYTMYVLLLLMSIAITAYPQLERRPQDAASVL
jgi:hypothetical protein